MACQLLIENYDGCPRKYSVNCNGEPSMRCAYQAYASHTVILDIFQTNPFVQPTFLLQQKKVGKKGRSRAMLFIQLLLQLSRVQLDSLEARLRPVEQPDKRPPWKAEGRTMQEQLSSRQVWVPIIMDVLLTNLKELH